MTDEHRPIVDPFAINCAMTAISSHPILSRKSGFDYSFMVSKLTMLLQYFFYRQQNPPKPSDEPGIIINGIPLSNAQAMTMRVALDQFITVMARDGLGDDDTSRKIADGYVKNGRDCQQFIQTPWP